MELVLRSGADGPTVIWAAMLIFLRVGAASALLPAFGEQSLPMRLRLMAATALTALVLPLQLDAAMSTVQSAPPIWIALSEAAIGLLLGITFRLFVIVLQVAGSVAAQSASLSQIFGAGVGAEPQPAFSTLFVIGGLALAAMAGLHVKVVEALLFTYTLLPIGAVPDGQALAEFGVGRVAHAFALGLTLATPFVLASIVYNLALGAINKAMPQLMVAFVGAPAISFGGLVLLLLTAPFLLSLWLKAFLADPTMGLGG